MNGAKKIPPASSGRLDPKDCSILRNPLKDLNGASSTASSSISSTSSASIEAPRGCLSFLISNSSSKAPLYRPNSCHKTPKSARYPKPTKPTSKHPAKNPEKPTPQGPQRTQNTAARLSRWQRGNSCSSSTDIAEVCVPHTPKPSPVSKENYTYFTKKIMESEEALEKPKSQQQLVTTIRVYDTGEVLEEVGLSSHFGNSYPTTQNLTCGSSSDATPRKDANAEREETVTTTSATVTPPVQASISPEIQLGSSMKLTTPACFAAGHVLSRVTDKRKCGPRGILTAREDLHLGQYSKPGACTSVDDDDDDDDGSRSPGTISYSRLFLIPTPAEASMHWLQSPSEEDQKGSPDLTQSPFSTPPGHGFSTDSRGSNSKCSRKAGYFICPSWSPSFAAVSSPFEIASHGSSSSSAAATTSSCKASIFKEERVLHRHDREIATESFSWNSLSSQNVICTPQSDSSSDECVGLSPWLKKNGEAHHQFMEFIPDASSLPMNGEAVAGDPVDVLPLPGFSFQFTHLTTPSYHSSHSRVQSTWRAMRLGSSGDSSGSGSISSPSRVQISWREGLVSRIFEMDEIDCCRWLSDEEKDVTLSDNDDFKCEPGDGELEHEKENALTFVNAPMTHKSASEEPWIVDEQNKVEKKPPRISCSCAESISAEGGCLVASRDSDWTQCYKNDLFQL